MWELTPSLCFCVGLPITSHSIKFCEKQRRCRRRGEDGSLAEHPLKRSPPREPVEKCRHQGTEPQAHAPRAQKSQRFLKVKKIQRSSSCLGDFVANDGFSSALREPFCIQKKTCHLEMSLTNHFDTPAFKLPSKINGKRCIPAGTVFVTRQEHRASIKTISEGWSQQ